MSGRAIYAMAKAVVARGRSAREARFHESRRGHPQKPAFSVDGLGSMICTPKVGHRLKVNEKE